MRTQRWSGIAGIAVAAAVVVACFSEDPEPMGPEIPAECRSLAIDAGFDPDDQGTRVIGIRGFAFVPAEVEVSPGTEVVWVNCEPQGTAGADHTSTSDDDDWDSPLLARGETYARVFEDAGVFDYHCEPHPFMVGTVRVAVAGTGP